MVKDPEFFRIHTKYLCKSKLHQHKASILSYNTTPASHTQIITMSDATFHRTKEDVRKPESRVSHQHNGQTPANSDVSAMKVSFCFRAAPPDRTSTLILC
jgi:uncharacterized protein (UPF0332 family)